MRDKGAKRAANRKLHIDDGCMGGGEAIAYQETNYVTLKGVDGPNNDIYDIKWGNNWKVEYKEYGDSISEMYSLKLGNNNQFEYERFRIFYYCVFDNQLDSDDKTIQNILFGTHLGQVPDTGRETLCVSKGHRLLNNGLNDDTNVAGVFMHELGHCLGLDRDDEGFHGYEINGPTTCMNYRDILNVVDYSEEEWDEIDLLLNWDYDKIRY